LSRLKEFYTLLKKNLSVLIYLNLLVLVFSHCQSKPEPDQQKSQTSRQTESSHTRINLSSSAKSDSIFSHFFTPVAEISLDCSNPESKFGSYDKVLYDPEIKVVCILDDYYQPGVYIFDTHGNFMAKLGREGHGPAEYISPSDFCFLPGKRIAITDRTQSKIMIYQYNGHFLNYLPLRLPKNGRKYTIYPDALIYSNKTYFVYTRYNPIGDYFIHKFDSTGEYVGSFHQMTNRCRYGPAIASLNQITGVTNRQIYFARLFQPDIFLYNSDENLERVYTIEHTTATHSRLIKQLDRNIANSLEKKRFRFRSIRNELLHKLEHIEFLNLSDRYIFVKYPEMYLLFTRDGDNLYRLNLKEYKITSGYGYPPDDPKVRFLRAGLSLRGHWKNGLIACGFPPLETPSLTPKIVVYEYRSRKK